MNFKKTADEIDDENDQMCGSQANKYKYTNYGRQYLVTSAYAFAFKMFEKYSSYNEEFELGCTLQGIITECSNAEI